MNLLKALFPFSFTQKNGTAALAVSLIAHILVGAVIGAVIAVLAKVPLVGFIFGIIGGLIDLYVLIGIVLVLLDYFKVLR